MKSAVVVAMAILWSMPSFQISAQETSPSPEEEGCQIGQICTDIDFNPEEQRGPIRDPAGRYVRSLVTMGAIGLLVVAYLFFAFGWGRVFSRFRRETERP